MSAARRLLVITYDFGSNGSVGGLRWAGLVKYLARQGWQVSVITAARPAGTDAVEGAAVEWCPRFWTLLDGYRLLRRVAFGRSLDRTPQGVRASVPQQPPGPLGQLTREVVAFLAFPDDSRGWMLRAALRARLAIRRFQPQVIVSSGPPHSAHLVAWLASLGNTVRWYIDLRDPWAGPLPKIWQSHRRLGTRLFRALSPRLERFAFRAADGVITTTRPLAQVLAASYPDLRVLHVANGVDPERLPPPAAHRYSGLGIAYAGTLYTGRDLGPVVRALRLFFDRHPEAARAGSRLRVAGGAEPGLARGLYESVAATGLQAYVEVLGPLPRAQAMSVVSRSRLAVVLAQEQELQVPAKLYESIAMEIPTLVLAPAGSATAVEGGRVGAVVRDPSDIEGIARVIDQLWCDDSRWRPSCPVAISYEAIAPLVDEILDMPFEPGRDRGRHRNGTSSHGESLARGPSSPGADQGGRALQAPLSGRTH